MVTLNSFVFLLYLIENLSLNYSRLLSTLNLIVVHARKVFIFASSVRVMVDM